MGLYIPRTPDAQWGNRLPCTAKNPLKFLGNNEKYFVCLIGPNFHISLINAFIWCPQSVLYPINKLHTCKSIKPSLSNSGLGSAANFKWLSVFLLTCKKGYQWKGVTMIIESNHSLPYSAYFWQETLNKSLSNNLIHSLLFLGLETCAIFYS